MITGYFVHPSDLLADEHAKIDRSNLTRHLVKWNK
jgi:hypothetical protein